MGNPGGASGLDVNTLSSLVNLIIVLSIASERFVEIIKGLVPWLNQEHADATTEGYRRASLQFLAVVAGIVTAYLARGIIPPDVMGASGNLPVLALGLLASGGSGFWNSVLTYVTKVKDVKSLQAKMQKTEVQRAEAERAASGVGGGGA